MSLRSRFPQWTALVVMAATTAGCASGENTADSGASRLWVSASNDAVPQSRGELKNAPGLDLSYARWQEQVGNLPEARQSYRRVLHTEPNSADALLGLARVEHLSGNSDAAENAYHLAIQAVPEKPQPYDALGQFYAAEQRWSDAVSAHARAVQIAPDDATYRHRYAAALAQSGDVAQALTQFAYTVGEAEAHYNVGYLLYEQGHTAAAEREFVQAVKLRPDLSSAVAMLDEIRGDDQDSPLQAENRPAVRSSVTQTAAFAPGGRGPIAPAAATSSDDESRQRWGRWAGTDQTAPTAAQLEQMRNQTPLPSGT